MTIDDITAMNLLVDPTFDPNFLSIGQQIVIPVCGVPTPTPTVPPTFTPVVTRDIPEPISTTTELPPGTVSVSIARVISAGDITREAVEIINEGSPVDLEDWTLSNGRGREFVFPAFRLFTGGGVTVFTGVGENTPLVLYWGLTEPVWRVGTTAFLYDADGDLQDELEVTP
jgi:hypothetical protein